jgi:flagellar motor component MotA
MKKFNFAFIIGIALYIFGLCLITLAVDGQFRNFIDSPILVFFLLALLGVIIATKSLKVFGVGFKAVLLPTTPLAEDKREQAASLFRFLSKATGVIIAIGIFIPLVNMLFGLDYESPHMLNHVGMNMAVVLLTPLYGLVLIGGVFEPIVLNLKKRR